MNCISGRSLKGGKYVTVDGELVALDKVQPLLDQIRDEADKLKEQTESLQAELARCRNEVADKESELKSLLEERDQLRVLLSNNDIEIGKALNSPYQLQNSVTLEVTSARVNKKKQGISAEIRRQSSTTEVQLTCYDKDLGSKNLINQALKGNDFLKNLDKAQIWEIVDCMYKKQVKRGDYIIRENEPGNHLYVLVSGVLEVLKDGRPISQIKHGRAFGELAILYGCTRTASVKVIDDASIWALERKVFQSIMMKTGLEQRTQRLNFLQRWTLASSVQDFSNLPLDKLSKIADVLEVDYFSEGQYIIREGEVGDNFYIISDGSVRVTQKVPGQLDSIEINRLGKGEYFGERALLDEDRRMASVIALKSGVEVLSINRQAFTSLIGNLIDFRAKQYHDIVQLTSPKLQAAAGPCSQASEEKSLETEVDPLYVDITLKDLEIVSTLGVGGFGRVELVRHKGDKDKVFAMKYIKKSHIVELDQQEHVLNEKKIMISCRSPFIIRLYKTFKDNKFVYLMMESCLGGELWTILRDMGYFKDSVARFVVACVIKAFQYLHSRHIIYRDLKPENLLVTPDGFVKLVDFGFAKNVPNGRKTWTFCGTPEYLAPEIILNKGHDAAVDIWATGILIYELTNGLPPFNDCDPMVTYNLILKGISGAEFPKRISKNAQHIVRQMCRQNPANRLGYQRNGLHDVMKHKWFSGFDWEGLDNRTIDTPLKRKVQSNVDTSYFDTFDEKVRSPPDELSGWDADF